MSNDTDSTQDWVAIAARATLPLISKCLPIVTSLELGAPHIEEMLNKISTGEISGKKAHRWLGWAQAAICMLGGGTLEIMKEINKVASQEMKNAASDSAAMSSTLRVIYNGWSGMKLAPTLAVELDKKSRWYGWLFAKHPDGQWVSLADLKPSFPQSKEGE